jgi:hypothetical protein
MATKKLPKTVYIARNVDGDDSYLLADDDLKIIVSGANDSPAIVGTYQLVETRKYRETVEEV